MAKKEKIKRTIVIKTRKYGRTYNPMPKTQPQKIEHCEKELLGLKVREAIREEKEKLLERIRLEKFKPIDRKRNVYYEDRIKGYNQAIADLEKLKKEIRKEL